MLTTFAGVLGFGGAEHMGTVARLGTVAHVGAVAHVGGQALAAYLGFGPFTWPVSGLVKELGGMLGAVGLVASVAMRRLKAERQVEGEQRLREEAIAYLTLDLSPRNLERSRFARLMSRTIATRSSFPRAALMLRDSSGAMTVAGSTGVDDLSVEALNGWGSGAAASLTPGGKAGVAPLRRVGACSFAVRLERREVARDEDPLATLGCARVLVTPIVSAAGLLGAIVVCAEPREATAETPLAQLLEPLEALALRLSTQLSELPGAQWSKAGKAATARVWERQPDRRRARGPQLQPDSRWQSQSDSRPEMQADSRTHQVTAKTAAKPARPLSVFHAPEARLDRSATPVTELRSAKLS